MHDAQKIILGIPNICLQLFLSHALILNKNPHLWMDTNYLSYLFACYFFKSVQPYHFKQNTRLHFLVRVFKGGEQFLLFLFC